MQVDGFRFDLATTLGRDKHARFDPGGGFFNAIRQDPVLSRVKLIAEPWDVGYEGYRLGGHGPGFAEWNDRFRNTVRAFWKGDEGMTPDLAARLLGSSDLFEHQGRRSWATVNFVTAHDGFTLEDVVSYNDKHNEANGEDNRDGHNESLSWNCGVEGPTSDAAVLALRQRQKRNMLATLLLAQGTPMLLMGDEVGRSQQGNNNAYCQDNAVSWLDWTAIDADDRALMRFVARLVRLRRSHPVLQRNHFLHGRSVSPRGVKDVTWFTPDGREMTDADWQDPRARCLGLMLGGEAAPDLTARGVPLLDATLLILLNAHHEPVAFDLPDLSGQPWLRLLDTAEPQGRAEQIGPGLPLPLAARSLAVMRLIEPASDDDELSAVERLGEAAVGVALHAAQTGEPPKGVAIEPALAPLGPEVPR
jgi:glycogen operon protein